MTSTKNKKRKKIENGMRTKIIPVLADNLSSEEEGDEDEGGVFLEKEDIQIIYNSLRGYKPTEEELQRYELLLESFEEILVVDYITPSPDTN